MENPLFKLITRVVISLLLFNILYFGLAILLGPQSSLIIAVVLIVFFGVFQYRFIFMGGQSLLRYSSRGSRARNTFLSQTQLSFAVTFAIFSFITWILYIIIRIFSDDRGYALFLALFLTSGIALISYHQAGRDMKEDLAHRDRIQEKWVQSIMPKNYKCQSCLTPLDNDDIFCPKCGFDNSKLR